MMLRWPWKSADTKKKSDDAARSAEDSTNIARHDLVRLREALLTDVANLQFEKRDQINDG